jgi:AAA+ ATPase superfamily predicted ATPase
MGALVTRLVERPPDMFDRGSEWSALSRFATDPQPGATLAVVSGRRRQGKTFLLDALCQAVGGFYFAATEATSAESLRQLGDALTSYLQAPAPLRPATWQEAVDVLLSLGNDTPVPVVLDEFPYLAQEEPALPSIIQAAFGPRRRQRQQSRARLLLCGSAMAFMGGLLAGNAPLRGRAGLELVVHPLEFRLAAEFWQITDPDLAVRVHAIVGGTPAYRREFVRDDTPDGPADFDSWVTRTVLDASSPLFREARYLLTEEAGPRSTSLYHSVLAAVAEGNTSRGAVASYLGRNATDVGHPLTVLEDAGLLAREPDAFRSNRSTFRITEPLLTFYHAVMRPAWGQLERPGSAERVWAVSRSRFESQVLGPHFESLCRRWALTSRAAEPLLGGALPTAVTQGVVNDPEARRTHEVDVVIAGPGSGAGRPPLLSIGEVKWREPMGAGHLERLRRVLALIERGGRYETAGTRLACYSGAGFSAGLQARERAGEVTLVGLPELYAE